MISEQKAMEALKTEMEKLSGDLTKLVQQTNENQLVKDELEHIEEEAEIYKLIGPGLVTQAVPEVRTNVNSRIELLKKETTKVEGKIKANRENQQKIAKNVEKMQQ